MNISAAIRFPFRGSHAWPNLGCVFVCFLIPVVGPIVILGYFIGVERTLIENIEADAPRFDFGKFAFYLTRGIWPFLVGLIFGFLVLPVLWVVMGAGFAGAFMAHDRPAIGISLIVLASLFYLGFIVILNVATMPMLLKAGLQEAFSAAFEKRFLVDFFKRVGLLVLGTYLLFNLILMPLAFLSICCLIVGPYFLTAIAMFINAHLQIQIYIEYLRRGGTPIPLKPEPPTPAFPVIPQQPPGPPPMNNG